MLPTVGEFFVFMLYAEVKGVVMGVRWWHANVGDLWPLFLIIGLALFTRWFIRKQKRIVRMRRIAKIFALGDAVLSAPFTRLTRHNKDYLMQVQDYRCANPYCNVDLRQSTPHLDHIVPRAEGGTDSLYNVQYLCENCNESKGDKNWNEWVLEYARRMGQDPNTNRVPLMNWGVMRAKLIVSGITG